MMKNSKFKHIASRQEAYHLKRKASWVRHIILANRSNYQTSKQGGSIIVGILIIVLFLTIILAALLVLSNANLTRARSRVLLLEAQYAAESGVDAAIAILNSGNDSYAGTAGEIEVLNNTLYKASYEVVVSAGATANERVITSNGKVYAPKTSPVASHRRNIEVISRRSNTTSALSIVSRNIIETASAVKDVRAIDVHANGYIKMNKNVTNLIAENITVASKNTAAGSCSIGGTGNLVKPLVFTHLGQSKTSIKTAFNNCIDPPGNNSNVNFDVLANQTGIEKINSTFIPFSHYMDSTYLNAGTCTDWTLGVSPRLIPSLLNDKKTHYPDNSSGVSSACGTLGDISLGSDQYTIRDHVHLRANLCVAVACDPTFFNPDPLNIKFIFVEGIVNFKGIQTLAGSGPIVLMVYGADPASRVADCPLGGALYLGKDNITVAPAIFLMANNGVCLDKTKFGATAALGGLAGKNIYIATNSGTPFDLTVSPTFPVTSVPLDLYWRAVRYRRL